MSSHVWKVVYQAIKDADRGVPKVGRKCVYSDVLVVAMYVWSVMHDRPLCWAAERSSYYGPFRPRLLPSRSQFGRRIKTARCEALLRAAAERLAQIEDGPGLFFMDGRPLPVGPYTQDRDAGKGFVAGRFTMGYKLHAIAANNGKIVASRVRPLNVSEKVVAFELIEDAGAEGIVLADGNYDIGKLYDHTVANGALLFTPLPENAGGGHRPQSPARLLAARMWENGGGALYKERTAIERYFSQQSSFGGGLAPLPSWVRGLERVERWVDTKLMIYHARLISRSAVA